MQLRVNDVNSWLTLGANLGVLVGIIFLILEINQANTIAEREARSAVLTEIGDGHKLLLQTPEMVGLLSKLRNPDSELTAEEDVQAYTYTDVLLNSWAQLNVALDADLIPVANEEPYLNGVRTHLRRYPRLLPYLRSGLISRGIEPGEFTSVYDAMWEEIEAAGI